MPTIPGAGGKIITGTMEVTRRMKEAGYSEPVTTAVGSCGFAAAILIDPVGAAHEAVRRLCEAEKSRPE